MPLLPLGLHRDVCQNIAMFSPKKNTAVPPFLGLMCWYTDMTCAVKWGSAMSRSFSVPLGVQPEV